MRDTFLFFAVAYSASFVFGSSQLDHRNLSQNVISNLQGRQAPTLPSGIPTQCVSVCAGAVQDMSSCGGQLSAQCICSNQFLHIDLPPCVNCVAGVNIAEQGPLQAAVDSITNGCIAAGIPVGSVTVIPDVNPGATTPAGSVGNTGPTMGITAGTVSSTGGTVVGSTEGTVAVSGTGSVGSVGSITAPDVGSDPTGVGSGGSSLNSTPTEAPSLAGSSQSVSILPPAGSNAEIKASSSLSSVAVTVAIIAANILL